jgi:hypothetical protein
MKSDLKKVAIKLRKDGYSYSEILRHVPIAKSTLSLWLRSVGLSKEQKQRLTLKKLAAARKGAEMRRQDRIKRTKRIVKSAIRDVNKVDRNTLKLMGVMLYWAEGSKEKTYRPTTGVIFSNSDPLMCKLFLKWLKEIVGVKKERIEFEIYVHETAKDKIKQICGFWAVQTGFAMVNFDKIYFKKANLLVKRRNTGEDYHGLLRIRVKKSTDLNRKIAGWIEGVCIQCGMV